MIVNLPVEITRERLVSMMQSLNLGEATEGRYALAVKRARWLLKIMTLRGDTKSCRMNADPGWIILLDLLVQEADGKPVSISSACIGSMAPSTTGLRWVTLLETEGVIYRETVPDDRRKANLRLSGPTREELISILTVEP